MMQNTRQRSRLRLRAMWTRKTGHWRLRRAALLLTVFVVLIAGYSGVRLFALHHADRVTVAVTVVGQNQPFYTGTFANPLASDAQRLLNDIAFATSPLENAGCVLDPRQEWHYHLTFSWRGMVVEGADTMTDGCALWTLSSLGLPDLLVAHQERYLGTIMSTLSMESGHQIPDHNSLPTH